MSRSEGASIETFTVSVKVIQIAKRQMTLSVFRQLPLLKAAKLGKSLLVLMEEKVVSPEQVWGKVNYFWVGDGKHDDQRSLTAHTVADSLELFHVVVQCNGALYRVILERGQIPADKISMFEQLDQLFIAV